MPVGNRNPSEAGVTRPTSLIITYAVGAAVFLAWGLFTLPASWAGHLPPAAGLLLVAFGLAFISGRLRAGRSTETLDNIWLWTLLGVVAGVSAGMSLAAGMSSGWRFVVGALLGAAIIGGLRWPTARLVRKRSHAVGA